MPVTKRDLALYDKMQEVGVLQRIDAPKLLAERRCIIAVFCGDGDRAHDIVDHHKRLWTKCHEGRAKTHLHTWNGGALRLLPGFPLNPPGADGVFLEELRGSVEIKKTRTFALHVHAPCSAARKAEFNLFQVVDGLLVAKRIVKENVEGAEIVPFLDFDKCDGEYNQLSWFVNREKWGEWRCPLLARFYSDEAK